MTRDVRLAVAGVGAMGRRHVQAIEAAGGVKLAGLADPADAACDFARSRGVPFFVSLSGLIAADIADGIILATPNQTHVENGLECVAAGLPVLVEKPIATEVSEAERLVAAAEAANVPLLVGHHRRHNPLIARARAEIAGGAIGKLVSVAAMTWFYKPDDYFDVEWRRRPGAGPVFLNLSHDIDLLHYLCGPIEEVQALHSSAVRGNPVEESCVIILRFADGALGTVNVSDTIVGPWSWELTAHENPDYPPTSEACYLIGGTQGSLELPALRLWRYRGKRSWREPIDATQLAYTFADPLIRQVEQFAAVIRGDAEPLVPGRDGLQALRIIKAVKHSAENGQRVQVEAC